MSESAKAKNRFVGYEYMEITIEGAMASMVLDCYENFGWLTDDNVPAKFSPGKATLTFKRDRKIANKAELTRLQRNCAACFSDISSLERSKSTTTTIVSILVGLTGTAFMAGSVFAVTNEPPIIWLCILLAIPAFIGCGIPPIISKALVLRKSKEVEPLIEQKHDETTSYAKKAVLCSEYKLYRIRTCPRHLRREHVLLINISQTQFKQSANIFCVK